MTCTAIYATLLLLQASVPFIYSHTFRYIPQLTECISLLHELFGIDSIEFHVLYVSLTLIELCAPILPIVISCTISISVLSRRRKLRTGGDRHPSSRHKRQAAVTVVLFTLLYIVCNVPFVLYEVLGTIR